MTSAEDPQKEESRTSDPVPDASLSVERPIILEDDELDPSTEELFTPESFSPNWLTDPLDFLGLDFEIPYRRQEWDTVVETLIELVQDDDLWTWTTAIAQLLTALRTEAYQESEAEDYQPRSLAERSNQIFEAIATIGEKRPAVLTEFALECDLSFHYPPRPMEELPFSLEQRDVIFATLLQSLSSEDYWDYSAGLSRYIDKLKTESRYQDAEHRSQVRSIAERFRDLCDAVMVEVHKTPGFFPRFCSELQFAAQEQDDPLHDLTLDWLARLNADAGRTVPTADAIFAAQLFFGDYNRPWQEVGEELITLLDHADLDVRACAAYQLARFCRKAVFPQTENELDTTGMPVVETIWDIIRDKEIERPGVAGAFWNKAPHEDIDTTTWLLDILEASPEPEPYIPYFPCNLAFDAHERFSHDAAAIRRLIDMGRTGLAVTAAGDEARKIPELAPLLEELGQGEEPEQIRIASWNLAYHYHELHAKGAALGYVELVDHLSEVDIFLLFSPKIQDNSEQTVEPQVAEVLTDEMKSLYAVVIYPKDSEQTFTLTMSQKWVEQIFPKAVRGPKGPKGIGFRLICRYRGGYVQYHHADDEQSVAFARGYGTKPPKITHITIGYRAKEPWNPKDYC